MTLTGTSALALFLTEGEALLITTAEAEAKALGKQFLPGLITRVQQMETNIGHPIFIQFKKEAEEAVEKGIVELAQVALAWCNES